MLLNRKAVRSFIRDRAPKITQVEKDFYAVLDFQTRQIILKAIRRNGKHPRLTTGELTETGPAEE